MSKKLEALLAKNESGCCPRFDPEKWEEKEVKWKDKLFLKDHVISFFHIPLNFGRVIVRNMEKLVAEDALTEDCIALSDENSLWGSDLYISVPKEVPDAETVKISGTFLTKVFEGSYRDMGKWIESMRTFVALEKKEVKKLYFFYTTCPKCAKFYGKNYVVIFAQID